MRPKLFQVLLLSIACAVPAMLRAQSASLDTFTTALPQTSPDKPAFHGFNAYESFSGLVTGSGALLKLDTSLGYDFNRSFGIFAGVPLYFTNSFDAPSSPGALREAGMGDAYLGAELYTFSKVVRYSTTITVGIPTGSVAKGFSPGRVTADWNNRFRRSFGKLTPALSIGVGNTLGVAIGGLPSSAIVDGSLAATGTFVHMEEGADFDLRRRVYIGGEGYHVLPFGNQRSSTESGGNTSLASSIVRENGFDTWIGFQQNSLVSTEVGYSRSTTFALNSFSFKIGLNVGRLVRRGAQK